MTIADALVMACYALVTVCFVLIAVLFYQSEDGRLRILLYRYFFALSWAAGLRAVEPYLDRYIEDSYIALAVGVPVAITGVMLVHFLHVTYKQGKGETNDE